MKNLSKLVIFLFFFLSLFAIRYSLFALRANAQIPGLKIPCAVTGDPEFHSLRPYQAAPCGTTVDALMCSNNLIFNETTNVEGKGDCTKRCEVGEFTCSPNFEVKPHTLYITLDDSMFPIMGNTEEVRNSQTNEEKFDDAIKVNEYASWYLSGVNNRAEYGENTDGRVINFSGPVQKLLPSIIADAQRIESIKKASQKVEVIDAETDKPMDPEEQTHNQIVVCANEAFLGILGKSNPKPCYEGNGSKAKKDVYRLKDWEGDLSELRGLINQFNPWGSDAWNKRTPPLPWDDGTSKEGEDPTPFVNDILYRKAYNEWKGKSCTILPIIGLVCIDNPLVANKWSELYQYVPMGITPDKKGSEWIFSVQPSGPIVKDSFIYGEIRNAPLYFAHTQEVKDLSEILNKTYTPLDFESLPLPKTTEKNECSAINVRSNKGDDLFPGDRDEMQVQDVTYTISEGKCKETQRDGCDPTIDPPCDCTRLKCTAEVTITIVTNTKTPWANEIWKTTVADSGSTFRKIFPKVEKGAPVSCIADIPAVTDVTYDASNTNTPDRTTYKFRVENRPPDSGVETPQLTFPHIGSIYEYFLKGIQTALRPKGYGEPIYDGKLCENQKETGCAGSIAEVAKEYNIPECQLAGIMEVETGGGQFMGSGSCSTNAGNFQCCHGDVCGPAQIMCSQYDGFDAGEKLDMCEPICSAELLARAMLLKLCQAAGVCDSYDWKQWGKQVLDRYSVPDGDYTAACYFYGLPDGCHPTACSQYRWGPGKSYGDSVKSYCDTGSILPDDMYPEFCEPCNEELVRAGQTPIDCSAI